jgi:SprT protein
MSPGLRVYAEKRLDELCESHPIGYRPKLIWKRLRVTAGQAFFRTGVIGLSAVILVDETRLEETLLHEYAHLMAYVRKGRKGVGHGEPWKSAMRELGQEPKVRHKYEVQRNAPRQELTYGCLRCGATFTRRRRLPKRRKYVHAACGGDLVLREVAQTQDAMGKASAR